MNKITNPVLSNIVQGNTGISFIQKLIPSLVGLGFVAGVIIFFFILLTGAIQWIVSGGDKGAIESARGKIVNAIIGVVILLSLFVIVGLIEKFFGINLLIINIGPLKIDYIPGPGFGPCPTLAPGGRSVPC